MLFFYQNWFVSLWICYSCSFLFVELIAQDRCFLSLIASLRTDHESIIYRFNKILFFRSLFFGKDQNFAVNFSLNYQFLWAFIQIIVWFKPADWASWLTMQRKRQASNLKLLDSGEKNSWISKFPLFPWLGSSVK